MTLFERRDQQVLVAIALTFLAALVYGQQSGQLGLTALLGGGLMGVSLLVAGLQPGGPWPRHGLPVLGMAMVGLCIHANQGRTEAHFAVFAFLAVVAVYARVLPLLLAAGAIAVHHLSFNYLQAWGWGPVCFTEPSLARVLEHAAYVVAETGVLVAVALRSGRDSRAAEELTRLTAQLMDAQGRIQFGGLDRLPHHESSRHLVDTLTTVRQAIAQVQASVSSIGTASREVAAGSQDLSRRTEETAANLERTTGSVAQLTERVAQSNAAAHTASELATQAAEVARQGGAVVGDVVRNMQEISESSRRIADIIGVIDGIAFQTNILALNAAVEAARAGEQGRGFAVVATEVRSLAGRSAQAAREIKSLIGASVDKVESGTQLVQSAGATMAEVVGSVQQVSDMIHGISAAAQAQAQEIQQVNQAVLHLDQMTQQNAALVEQSSAAAESLQEQASHLARAIQRFEVQPGVATA